MKKDVSIVIVNYQTPQLCLDCVRSIIKYSHGFEYEIILVDNGSKDDSLNVLSKELSSYVILVESEKNIGFGRANNLAAQYAKGDYLFFLNSDTLLIDNSIFTLFEFIKKHEDVACVGGILLNAQGEEIHSYASFPKMKTSLKVALSPLKKILIPREKKRQFVSNIFLPFDVEYITGADLMIRREVWTVVGGFDPDIFMYFEESDLQKKVAEIGWKRMIEPRAKIIHLEGKSLKMSNFKRIVYNKSLLYYMQKNHGNISFFFFKLLLFIIHTLVGWFDVKYTGKEKGEFIRLFNPFINQNYKS